MKTVVNAVSIRRGAILLLLKRDVWIPPGGKLEAPESYHDCLRREISEELPKSQLVIGEPDGSFHGVTPHTGEEISVKVYEARIEGDLTPGAEISAARYFTKEELKDVTVSKVTQQIIDNLIVDSRL